ncbi:DUF4405 domain-containing protein [Candidatus Woesearchaeota archaeon]|nr:DUF4405 domain-containing protein [Candidatus Woesearchaeota archaeon]
MDKTKLKYFVDVGLAISFFVSLITGIFKFPGLTQYFTAAFRLIPHYYMSRIHDWSGLVMGSLVFVHLILNWKWIVAMTKRYIGGGKK